MRLSLLCFLPVALVSLAGCDEPVPPTPRGAWTVSTLDPGIDCNIAGHNTKVGDVGPNTKVAVLTDGTEGSSVSCTVTDIGGGNFKVDASMDQADKYLDLFVPSIAATATETEFATGGIGYSSVNTVKTYQSTTDMPCQFYFVPNSGEGIAAGKVWFAFKCPVIEADGSACELKQGYAIFENCSE